MTTSENVSPPHIRIVVAYARNRVIGRDNQLPWRLPGDMKHFRQTTLGHPIVMGRKTWESLGRALPGRHNIVVTRHRGYAAADATVAASLEDALRAAAAPSVCVIGGAQLYAQALPLAHEVVATEVHADVAGDAFFPALDARQWRAVERRAQPEENGLAYDFVTYQRLEPA